MKQLIMVILAVAGLAATGCRRTDVREMVVDVPEMASEGDRDKIVRALGGMAGLELSSVEFDMAGRRVKLRYDSMVVAHKNIEIAIAEAGYSANSIDAIRKGSE